MVTDQRSGTAASHPGHAHRAWPYRRSFVARYGWALIAVLVAFSARYLIYSDINYGLVFTFFVPAAMIGVWYGGLGPGLLATVLGLIIGDYFFLPPRLGLWPVAARELLALGAYGVTTAVCVILCENLHHVVRRCEHALDQARHHADGASAPDASALPPAPSSPYGWPFRRPMLARYGVAVAVVALAFALRYAMFGTEHHRFPFIFFVPAAIIATWYGGMMPGLLATAAGLMLGDYFFLAEHEALGPVRETERLAIGLYAVTTTLCVMLFESLHNRIRRLEHALDYARYHQRHPPQAAAG